MVVGLGSAVGEAVGLGAGFDDVAADDEPVDDGVAETRGGEGLVQPPNDSLDAIATEAFSSRSGRDLEEEFGAVQARQPVRQGRCSHNDQVGGRGFQPATVVSAGGLTPAT